VSDELIREVLRRQEAFSEQLEGVSRCYDALSEQLGDVRRRHGASSEEHTQLVAFLGKKFGAIDRRFDAVDRRFVKIEVDLEGARDERKILAEGIRGTNERLDRFLVRLERLEAS
jgi:predicted  nucleic acid-binding Zn-ribbon protein